MPRPLISWASSQSSKPVQESNRPWKPTTDPKIRSATHDGNQNPGITRQVSPCRLSAVNGGSDFGGEAFGGFVVEW